MKEDGSVVSWPTNVPSHLSDFMKSGVGAIYSTGNGAFAAMNASGAVATWGDSGYGGDSSSVSEFLKSGVTVIYSNRGAFAAMNASDA